MEMRTAKSCRSRWADAYARSANAVRAIRLLPRQRPRSPDRQASRDRRRQLGGSSALPDTLRRYCTEGQRAALCAIAGEIKHHGVCDLPIDKIAALAGVCRTTVQTTLHEARRMGHIKITERPVRGRKSLTNLVEILSKEMARLDRSRTIGTSPIGSICENGERHEEHRFSKGEEHRFSKGKGLARKSEWLVCKRTVSSHRVRG